MLTTGISRDYAPNDIVDDSIQRVLVIIRNVNSGFIIQRFT